MTAILLIIIAAVALWVIGGVALRWGGLAAIALGFAVALGVESSSGLILLVAGALVWLGGHVHYRMRHGGFKSDLAGFVLSRGN